MPRKTAAPVPNDQSALQSHMSSEVQGLSFFNQMVGIMDSANQRDSELSLKSLALRERKVVAYENIARLLELIANAYAFSPEGPGYEEAKEDFESNKQKRGEKKRKQ